MTKSYTIGSPAEYNATRKRVLTEAANQKRKVQYSRAGTREGWVGTITDLRGDRITIHYEEHDVVTDYSISAVSILPALDREDAALRFEYGAYLQLLPQEEEAHRRSFFAGFLVVDEHGNTCGEANDLDDAKDKAKGLAAADKASNRYRVYTASFEYQREDPPVKETRII